MEEYEDLFETKIDLKSKYYVFLRLYDTKYKKNGLNSIFNAGTKHFDIPNPITKLVYTHAAINATLNDKFLGLNPAYETDLYIETIDDEKNVNKTYDTINMKESLFSIFYCEIEKSDYIRLKEILNIDYSNRSSIKYTMLGLGMVAINKLVSYFKKMFEKSSEASDVDLDKNKFICSTFCSYILSKLNYFKNKIGNNYAMYSPNDLVNKLQFQHLCTGKWNEYHKSVKKSLKTNPSLQPFYNEDKE